MYVFLWYGTVYLSRERKKKTFEKMRGRQTVGKLRGKQTLRRKKAEMEPDGRKTKREIW